MPNPFLAEVDPIPYLKSPALSPDGQTLYFAHAGDIWSVGIEGGDARQVTSSVGDDTSPRVSPDGSHLAFVSTRTGIGDLYVLQLETGGIRRLTFFDGVDAMGGWSPDGEWVAFSSRRDALSGGIYKVGSRGGTPIELVLDPRETHTQAAYSPDGTTLAFVNDAMTWWRRGPHPAGASAIWTVGHAEGADDPRRLTTWQGRNTHPMWDPTGESLYYLSDEGGVENVWRIGTDGSGAESLTSFTGGRCFRASIQPGGRRIAIDRDDGIWRLDPETRTPNVIPIRVVADQKTHPVASRSFTGDLDELAPSPDGKKLVFAVHGELFAAPAAFEETYDAVRITNSPFRESQIDWDPESKSIVYLSDREGENQIYKYEFAERVESQLTESEGQKYLPIHSPDGKWIAYLHKQDEIRLICCETGEVRPFITDAFFGGVGTYPCFAWSPDSQWIVFISLDESFFCNLFAQRVDEESPHQITFLSQIGSFGPHWSPDGFILFSTQQYRTQTQIARVDLKAVAPVFWEDDFEKLFEEKEEDGNGDEAESNDEEEESPKEDGETEEEETGKDKSKDKKEVEPVEITFEGIKRRLRLLTPMELSANARAISPDGKHLLFSASVAGRNNLFRLSLEEQKRNDPPRALTDSKARKGSASFHPNGKSILYLEDGTITRRGFPDGKTKKLRTRCRLDVDFDIEKRQVFQEAWTLLRDHYYDPEFHGADWERVRDRMLPLVVGVRTRPDLVDILNRMVGELNSSHLGAGGNSGPQRDGYLGLGFKRDPLESDGTFEVAHVLPDGPCDTVDPPVRAGDILEAIDGRELGQRSNLWELLNHMSGKKVRLRLRSPEGDVRETAVRPVNAGTMGDLAYRKWVGDNAEYVYRISKGRLGYAHVRAMGLEDLQQFLIDLDTEAHGREAVVVDVRYNPGGHIATFILDVLAKRDHVVSSYRGRLVASSAHVAGNRILGKPTVLLTNEHSGSNAEMFSEGYRSLGLGKVVGTPTAGAVIWTSGSTLLDGTVFRIPFIRVATREGENLELNARPVDIHVERQLGEAAKGIDSQIDKAVEVLLGQIDTS